MSHSTPLFDRALQLHQAGRVQDAVALYLQLLPGHANNAQLRYLLGTAYSHPGTGNTTLRLESAAHEFPPG